MSKRRAIYAVLILVVLAGLASIIWQKTRSGNETALSPYTGAPASITDPIKRGEYLARAADCVACHTEKNGIPFAGGYPIKLPFGTIYGSNITPDMATGIGNWSDDQFIRAVREGIGPDGNLYPAMPYTSYSAMTREDVLSIKAYLFSLKPVTHVNKDNDFPFPFNQRWGMKFWNAVFADNDSFRVDMNQDPQWNRGAYLATALGHCGECHTPRNFAFAMNSGDALSGTTVQGWFAPNITPDSQTGIGQWTDDQLSDFLARGHANGRSSASGPMAEAVENSLQYLTSQDNAALVKYLKGIPPVNQPRQSPVNLRPAGAAASSPILPGFSEMSPGARTFANECSGCHLWNGKGRQTNYADLVGSTAVNDPQATSVVQAILNGTSVSVGEQRYMMPGFAGKLTDREISDLANYVVKQFGNREGKVTPESVKKQRQIH